MTRLITQHFFSFIHLRTIYDVDNTIVHIDTCVCGRLFHPSVTWGVGKKIKIYDNFVTYTKQAHVLGIKKRDYGIVIICTSVVRLFIIFNFKRGNNRSRIQNMSAINVGVFFLIFFLSLPLVLWGEK